MSKIKRSSIILLVVTSIIVLLLGFVALTNGLLNKEYAYASETSSATISGTSVRTEADSLGIRFTASIDHEQLKAENGGKNFSACRNAGAYGRAEKKSRQAFGRICAPSQHCHGVDLGAEGSFS